MIFSTFPDASLDQHVRIWMIEASRIAEWCIYLSINALMNLSHAERILG